jgi:hypothetical protein
MHVFDAERRVAKFSGKWCGALLTSCFRWHRRHIIGRAPNESAHEIAAMVKHHGANKNRRSSPGQVKHVIRTTKIVSGGNKAENV